MLVLERRRGESIVIRQHGVIIAEIMIGRIEFGKVRLSFKADHEVQINRSEVDSRKFEQPAEAS